MKYLVFVLGAPIAFAAFPLTSSAVFLGATYLGYKTNG